MSNIKRFSFLILSVIICFGNFFIPVVANGSYQSALAKGTDFFIVSSYDADKWSDTFIDSILPTTFFDGESNITGAESKVILYRYSYISLDFYGIIKDFIFQGQQLADLIALEDYGYNESKINILFPNNYLLWSGLQAVWFFNSSESAETPNTALSPIFIFKNPSQFKDVLEFRDILRNDDNVNKSKVSALVNYTSDEFLRDLAFNGLALGVPIVSYLNTLITELNPDNATSSTDTDGNPILIINGYSRTNYTLVFKYGSDGTFSEFKVKDETGFTIYHITSYNREGIFYIALIIIIGVMAALIGLYLYMHKKRLSK